MVLSVDEPKIGNPLINRIMVPRDTTARRQSVLVASHSQPDSAVGLDDRDRWCRSQHILQHLLLLGLGRLPLEFLQQLTHRLVGSRTL